ncbi:2OG-Fe(II) oxygenase [Chromohalobacter sp. HP20-39]|uniref:2OG-Fe(II) oxygenase n=1 Tax=Chromohalobacter sp. HP20-39 TaxID=3079306 RepID=UPI00294ABBFF|nr:2OG-Fe(II) oxygenase [Chromohalobacter sp. HP20-39]MDV6317590.1 2OG-Fe(II) oxygenase [Chromohalobacter sp. HP20-39]
MSQSNPADYLDMAALPRLLDALVTQGWFVGERFIDTALCHTLQAELQTLKARSHLDEAGIGRGQAHRIKRDVRGDAIHWLDRESRAQRQYLTVMTFLQQAINRELYLGLFEFEAHFALYPPGAFYKKHLDSFRGRSNRIISTVLYLNPAWTTTHGGEMALFDPDAPEREIARIHPELGTFVCFLADRIPHEVLPTQAPRASIAGWFRRNTSLGGTIDPAR